MQSGHDPLGRILDLVAQIRQLRLLRPPAEFPDIGAGDERAAVAEDQHRLRAVLPGRAQVVPDARTDGQRERVDRRVVDRDYTDVVDEFVAHGRIHAFSHVVVGSGLRIRHA